MTIERAVDNAIVSTEMEGFVITEKHKETSYEKSIDKTAKN